MLRLGRYELLRRIALGGMAEIFMARETGLAGFQRHVVIKRVLPALGEDEGFVGLFLDEARLAARLTHPKIVHIYELGQDGGTYFVAMEYVPGCDLESLLSAAPGPLPLAESLFVISEVLEGLHYAHGLTDAQGVPLGVVHRDVAPKNVLVSLGGAVKVVDFGIAKARTKASVTAPGLVMGTVSFMSPEQASGRPVDRRSDVFAAGAMLYRMLTGQNPYQGDGLELIAQVRSASFPPIADLAPDVPEPLARVAYRAMTASPEARYPTAAHMRRDVGNVQRSLGLESDSEALGDLVRERLPHLERLLASWVADPPIAGGPAPEQTTVYEPSASSVERRLRAPARSAAEPPAGRPQGEAAFPAGTGDPDAPTQAFAPADLDGAPPVGQVVLSSGGGDEDDDDRETWPLDGDGRGLGVAPTVVDPEAVRVGLDDSGSVSDELPTRELPDEELELEPEGDTDLMGLELPEDVERELEGGGRRR